MKNIRSLPFLKHMMKKIHYYKLKEKSWGYEYWLENNEQYCGKILQVLKNEWSSFGAFHYHKIKDETFLVISGTLMLDILDLTRVEVKRIVSRNAITLRNGNDMPWVNRYYLTEFDYMRLVPGVLHRFSSLEDECMFVEISTTHREEDSYRIVSPYAEDQLEEYQIDHKHGIASETTTQQFSYKEFLKKEFLRGGGD